MQGFMSSEWLVIRDTFLGHNLVPPNVELALNRARKCNAPNARWLSALFPVSSYNMMEVFRLDAENDVRSLTFFAILDRNLELLAKAANLGDAFAQAYFAWRTSSGLHFAELAAQQGERDGFERKKEKKEKKKKKSFCVVHVIMQGL
jgi:hypothetical protein